MLAKLRKACGQSYRSAILWVASTTLAKACLAWSQRRGWAKFLLKNPTLAEYKKPYLEPRELAYKLISQGLIIGNRRQAEQIIFRENYFRFKAYAIPFFDRTSERFHTGTTFDDLHDLYCADQQLRDFLLPILAQLEVRIRATVDNVITDVTKDPFWYLNPEHFQNFSNVERALSKAQQRFDAGKQDFVVHYRNRYYTRRSFAYRRAPPFWIISEIFTLEQLLSVCRTLNENHPVFLEKSGKKNKLKRIGTEFGVDSYGSLRTNLSCILELRNLCAHHSRLWNRNLQNPGGLKGKHTIAPSHNNRLYSHLLMLRIACKKQGILDGIQPFMLSMFAASPIFTRDMANMGFPTNWHTDPVWI